MVLSGITSAVTATAGESSGAVCRHFRLVLPDLAARLLPARGKPPEFLRLLRRALPDRRAERDRVPPAPEEQFARWAEQTPPGFRSRQAATRTRAPTLGTFAERVRLLGERLGPVRALCQRLRDEACSALLLGSFDPSVAARARPPARVLGRDRGGRCRRTPSASTARRPTRRSATSACASRRTRTRTSAAGRSGYGRSSTTRSRLLLLQARGRADGAGVRGAPARAPGRLSSTICSTAKRSSSSVLKKCGPRRMPASGRQSQMISRVAELAVRRPRSRRRARRPCRRAGRVARRARLEPGSSSSSSRSVGLLERALADPPDADLLDHVVAGGRGVERGHVRRPGQEARGARRVVLPRLEGEGPRVRLPAGQRRLERLGQIGPHVEPAAPGPPQSHLTDPPTAKSTPSPVTSSGTVPADW